MNIKRIIRGVMAFVLAAGVRMAVPAQDGAENSIMSVSVSAATSVSSGFTIETGSDGIKTVTGYSGTSAVVNIPEGVTAIGDKAFYNNTVIKNVTIPKGCTVIGEMAFYGCPKL